MSFSPAGGVNGAPPNLLAGFEGPHSRRGKRGERERREEKGKEGAEDNIP